MALCLKPANAEELRKCIVGAFADAAYPGDSNIAANPNCCPECRETDEFFRGRHWKELAESDQELQTNWGGLSFLSPEAWHFYLPAYMLAGLEGGEYAGEVSDTVLFHLSPTYVAKTGDLTDYFSERASGFSLAQQECIAAYAVAFSEMEPDDETYAAAATFWREKSAEAKVAPLL